MRDAANLQRFCTASGYPQRLWTTGGTRSAPPAAVFALLLAVGLAPPLAFATSVEPTPVEQATAALCDKRIALLGELPSHGEGKAFAAKAEIARALVDRCGFRAVLFEAPIYDFLGLEPDWKNGKATPQRLDDAIGRFWWARELADWRRWLYDAARSGVLVGGLDDQVSATSKYAGASLPGLYEGEECRAAVERNLQWTYDEAHPFDEAEKTRLHSCTAVDAGGATVDGLMRANFGGYVSRQVNAKAAPSRDQAMHSNARHYLERLPAGSKVVVWTATVHAARVSGDLRHRPLGAWLHEDSGFDIGSIGFSALAGSSSMAGQPAKEFPALAADSLEARVLGNGRDSAYADAAALRALGVVESRLYGKPVRADWSPRFDGVIVFRQETPATFEARP